MSALPFVKGFCPACGSNCLFLGAEGYVTCSWIRCPERDAAATLLSKPRASAALDKETRT